MNYFSHVALTALAALTLSACQTLSPSPITYTAHADAGTVAAKPVDVAGGNRSSARSI